MPENVTRPYTLEKFMKGITTLRISGNVLEDFIRALDELVAGITRTSADLAEKENRKTIMPVDLDNALDEILGRGPLTVDELIEKIEPLSIIELSQLSGKVKQKADELLKPKRSKKRPVK